MQKKKPAILAYDEQATHFWKLMNNESIVTFSLTLFGSVHISENDFVMYFNTDLFHKYLYIENTSTSELTVAFFKFPIRMICDRMSVVFSKSPDLMGSLSWSPVSVEFPTESSTSDIVLETCAGSTIFSRSCSCKTYLQTIK